jgi:acetyl esterase
MTDRIQLEPEAQAFAEAEALSPLLVTLGPEQGRLALDETQSGRVRKHPVDMEDLTITDGPSVHLALRILRPSTCRFRCRLSCISTVPGGCSAACRRMTG